MDRFLGHEIADAREREQYLRDNADAVEEMGYTKSIPPAELDRLKDELVETVIELNNVEDEKKEVDREFTDRIKKHRKAAAKISGQLKARSEYVVEKCYKFVDGSEVGYYNSDGELVFSRPARPEERQLTVFNTLRTGTDN